MLVASVHSLTGRDTSIVYLFDHLRIDSDRGISCILDRLLDFLDFSHRFVVNSIVLFPSLDSYNNRFVNLSLDLTKFQPIHDRRTGRQDYTYCCNDLSYVVEKIRRYIISHAKT